MGASLRTAELVPVTQKAGLFQAPKLESAAANGGITISVYSKPAAIENDWRLLEDAGAATLFQSFDWIAALCRGSATAFGEEPFIVAGHDRNGDIAFIWPMAVKRVLGVNILTWLGSWCSTCNAGLFSPAAALAPPNEVTCWFNNIAQLRPDIAAVLLEAQPTSWNGVSNPIVRTLASRESGDYSRIVPLQTNFKAFFEARFSGYRRRRICRARRILAGLGPVRMHQAAGTAERHRFIDTFLRQRLAQLEKARSPSIFENPATMLFLRDLACTNSKSFTVDMIFLSVGDTVVATRWGFKFKDRFYSYAESLDDGPARRGSPGTLLRIDSFARECQNGTAYYDMGPGPGEHKDVWRPADAPLMNSWLVFKARGWLPTAKDLSRTALKRQIRAHPKLLNIWRDARFTARGILN